MVDPGRVERKLTVLRRYRDRLGELRAMPEDAYLTDRAYEGRYVMLSAIQACIDIASHVIASEGWRVPNDLADTFKVLRERGLIDRVLSARLVKATGMRNRLVHDYADIDDTIVFRAFEQDLEDFDAFARAVANLVASSDS